MSCGVLSLKCASALILGWALALPVAWAQPAAVAEKVVEIPVETMFKKTAHRRIVLSPDQKFMAAVASANGRQNLLVLDIDKRSGVLLTNFSEVDVSEVRWANNQRLMYTTGDQQGIDYRSNGGLFAIDRDGKNSRMLVEPVISGDKLKFVFRETSVLSRLKGGEEVMVSANDRSEDSQDVYRMNVMNGRKTLVNTSSPGKVSKWVLDDDNVPRATLSVDEEKKRWWFSYRAGDGSTWKTLAEWNEQLKDVIIPLDFDPADKGKMYVASNVGRDTLALFKFDPQTGKLGELVYADERHDIASFGLIGEPLGEGGELVFGGTEEEQGKLLGLRYYADKPRSVWFDEAAAKAQATLDRALPGAYNTFNPNHRRTLVRSRSDVNPGEWYFFDQDKRSLEETGIKARPQINPKLMAPMLAVTWTARDGMRIDGYLTLPRNYVKGSPVPLVLHPHGGPWAKDNWEYNSEVQFMANRGFAVLQPNFRGSTGYGAKHLRASYKQWGAAMIDDMIDGVEWAIKEGYADKNRVAVYGASYGGYSTLMAMVKRPDLFKWGINYVGVTDMTVHQDTQPAQRYGKFGELAKAINGDQRADRDLFDVQSPARQVAKIAAPVFHAYGGEDRNVDFANGSAIKSAFEKAGKPFEWQFVGDEAHGYRQDKNVFDFYNRFDKFMKQNTPAAK